MNNLRLIDLGGKFLRRAHFSPDRAGVALHESCLHLNLQLDGNGGGYLGSDDPSRR